MILALADSKAPEASLVVTGCLAERYGAELAEALPEADRIAGFGMALTPNAPGPSPAAPALTGAGRVAPLEGARIRPAQPAAAPLAPTLGVCEDRRRM